MRQDRYTKTVLTIIAVGLWVLTLIEIGGPVPSAQAHPTREQAPQLPQAGGPMLPSGEARSDFGTSTKPLRWRVLVARQTTAIANTICGTVVSVQNLAPQVVTVDVEWIWISGPVGGSKGLTTVVLGGPGITNVVWTSIDVDLNPINGNGGVTNTGEFTGWANVHATDPRIHAAAHIICRDAAGFTGTQNLTSIVFVPAVPVGATAEFFTAGMPGMGTPLITPPESLVPQSR